MTAKDRLERPDDLQKDAVYSPARFTLVVAGPGSGKTSVLAARLAWQVSKGIPPGNILGLTFTNKAAEVMRKRASLISGVSEDLLSIGTFHGFSLMLLKREIPHIRLISRAEAMDMLAAIEPCLTKKIFE
ncbi:MAG: UvrD-helicase domain-containing protein [Deltaproteobacteria bacterium]|nr:UvrD-helicase domain-containing protein [Deltaproteobacteria bacterium]